MPLRYRGRRALISHPRPHLHLDLRRLPRTRSSFLRAMVAAMVSVVMIAGVQPIPSQATVPTDYVSLPRSAFTPVVQRRTEPVIEATSAVAPEADTPSSVEPVRAAASVRRPVVSVPQPAVRTISVTTGRASWYRGSRGFGGTRHAAQNDARWTGKVDDVVKVCVVSSGRCAKVKVVDYCQCFVGSKKERLIDLSIETVRKLRLDPDDGIWTVTVSD